ncbi:MULTISPECIES: ATP-binding protein [unclassified Streptomyces]|uniref:ATP-binding protein n=1 Tax=unclassified Streptomyces TaxID=2593676 RepID=UPI00081EE0D7|nr:MULTISPECIES: ATP-binding protein [unclassified Streptomyces]MYZ38929.1 AAA family ATPase [Streptomyces sp. SID4917]SCG01168.1 ATPase family associated with various cellular activities (AAA) [Streptomyces sp. MnatMP-M17]
MTDEPQRHDGLQQHKDPNLRHLLARAVVVEQRIRRAVEARQLTDPHPDDAFRGLYLTEETITRLLDEGRTFPVPEQGEASVLTAPDEPPSRLTSLATEFGLSPLDVEILLIALVPDLDDRFEAFYGYLNDDVTRRRPTIGLALGLCGFSPADASARARLGPHAPLRSGGILLVEEAERPFLGRALRVPDRVTMHLLGDDTPDPRLTDLLAPWHAVEGVGDPGPLARMLGPGIGLAYLREDQGGAGTAVAASALSLAGRGVLGLDLSRLTEDPTPAEAVRALVREARLTGAGLVCAPLDALARDRPELLRLLTGTPLPTVLVGRVPWDAAWSARPPLLLHAPRVEPSVRAALWQDAYAAPVPSGLDIPALLSPFLLTPDQIEGAARGAAQTARLDGGTLTSDHVRQGARAQNAAGLDRLARRIEPAVSWSDLVLPADTHAQLRELTARARYRDQVLGAWGMRPGGGRGRGVSALFAGDSGTGKTMSAEVIAADLGLDLYTVDLATVIDKYVGETEKNLERIFTEAAGVNGVLLFDEADAIFGKRSEVKDAHDRYANVESAYLLQRMESFDGLAILATNLRANLDDAFTRRLDLVIDFPIPDPTQRRLLWDRSLGRTLPRAPDLDLDLDFCAESFELAGGNIRSVAVTAAYLSAESATPVSMPTLIHAIQREYQKLGRLTLASEFGPYLDLLT